MMTDVALMVEDANRRLVEAAKNALRNYGTAMVEQGLDAPEIKRRLCVYTEQLKDWCRQSMGEVYLTAGLAITKPATGSVN